ncbi:MAG: hypothetical protein KME32_33895 [Mojavia pulchra JT2-VF2]|uniref:Replication origin-binding protein domain-containing protein n=1 Tax=Mojavia pulchra JT2-VF2 TaxID=287848 RepID=A0A951UL89_9NOST|nr:hypothetical protein [Mojavia pulchra JT2-VF2]
MKISTLKSTTSSIHQNLGGIQYSSQSSSDKPHPTNRHNPCPICGDISGKCRTKNNQEQGVLCGNSAGYKKWDKEGLYVCVNDNAKGHTTHTWVLAQVHARRQQYASEKEQSPQTTAAKEQSPQRRTASEKKKQSKPELPVELRDALYRKILSQPQFKLSPGDLANLQKRGLTDKQIDTGMYRSVTSKFPRVLGQFPFTLPGVINVQSNVATLNAFPPGILCPIFQGNLIVGLKVRKTDVQEGGRYYWATSCTGKNPHGLGAHINGELPLAFLPGTGDEIWVTEGSEIKPVILHNKKGVTVAGGGRSWHSSPEHFKRFQQHFDAAKKIVLCPDAGDIINRQVAPKWLQEADFFEKQGYIVSFAWWGQVTKEEADIDELEDYSQIEFISAISFEELTKEHTKEAYKEESYRGWKNKATTFSSKNCKAFYSINTPEFQLPEGIPAGSSILAIKSDMGTGKTNWLLSIIKKSDIPCHLPNYRNNLIAQIVERGKDDFDINLYHINEDEDMAEEASANLLYCVDSYGKIDAARESFKDVNIILDESCSVILHLIQGGTLKERQAKIIKIFKKSLRQCKNIFLLDGNLADIYVDLIAEIAPNKTVYKVENTYKIAPHNFIFVDGVLEEESEIKRKRDNTPLTKLILEPGVRPFVFCDSKTLTNVLAEILKAEGKSFCLINADTIEEPWARECMKNPDKYFGIHKPEVFLLSPTGNSGISCTSKGWWNCKISIFYGVLPTNGQLQSLFRNRDESIPHYIFCPERSMIRKDYLPNGYVASAIERNYNERLELNRELVLLQADNPELAASLIDETCNACKKDEIFGFSNWITAIENFERDNLRKCLSTRLEEKGHNVERQTMVIDSGLKNKQKKVKQELQIQKSQDWFNAEDLPSEEEFERLIRRQDLNKKQRDAVQKHKIKNQLPGIENDPTWSANFIFKTYIANPKTVEQYDRYFLLKHYDELLKIHNFSINRAVTAEDVNFGVLLGLKRPCIALIKTELNSLEEFQVQGKEFHKKSPEITELIEKVRSNKKLKAALGINKMPEPREDGKEIIEITKKILGWVGIKLKATEKKLAADNKRLQHYTFDYEHFNSPDRLAILKCLEAKYADPERVKEREKITWVNEDYLVNCLAGKFRNAQSYTDVTNAIAAWESKKQFNADGSFTQEQDTENRRIDLIISWAWDKLKSEELARVRALQMVGLNDEQIFELLDKKIIEDKPEYKDVDFLNKLPVRWQLRLEKAVDYGQQTVDRVKAYLPQQPAPQEPKPQAQAVSLEKLEQQKLEAILNSALVLYGLKSSVELTFIPAESKAIIKAENPDEILNICERIHLNKKHCELLKSQKIVLIDVKDIRTRDANDKYLRKGLVNFNESPQIQSVAS